jgi:hypothetical protein
MHPRFAIHASAAASRGTTSSAVRPDGKLIVDDLDPRRPRSRRALLVEELAVDAVRVADEHVRPPARAAERPVGDREVVLHDVELRDAASGK